LDKSDKKFDLIKVWANFWKKLLQNHRAILGSKEITPSAKKYRPNGDISPNLVTLAKN
jgi:hypothetical protein